MSEETSNMRYKLKEFEWFQMETRVRQMVQDLITPFSKRVFETMSNMSSLKAFTMDESIKLEQLRKIVTDDPNSKQINIFKTIDKRHNQIQLKISQLRNLVGQTQSIIDKRFQIQDQRLQQNRQIIVNNMKLKQRITTQIMEQNNNLKNFRVETQSIIDDFSNTLSKIIKEQEDDLKITRQSIIKLTNRIDVLQQLARQTESKFQNNRMQHLKFHKDIIHIQQSTKLINREIEGLNETLSYTKRLSNYVKDLQQRLNRQDLQLQHLSPLVTQAQISETLFHILPSKYRKRLLVYDHYKYSKMNIQVLEADYKKPAQMFNGLGMLQSVQMRTTKQIIDMKRRKLKKQGINIDNMTYELKEKYYNEVDLLQDNHDEEEETKLTPGVDKEEVASLVQEMMEQGRSQMARQISLEFDDSRKYIQSLEQQLHHNFVKSNQQIDKLKNEANAFKVQQQLQHKYFEGKVDIIREEIGEFNKEISSFKGNLSMFIKFCSLVNHLQIQDQLDKQSISLFGIKQTFNEDPVSQPEESYNPKKIIDFKKQCFSCCGFPASTMTAFKMACLTYAPSSINIQDREYRRQQILEMSTKLLRHLKQQLHPSLNIGVSQSHRQNRSISSESEHTNIFLYSTTQCEKDTNKYKDPRTTKSKRVNTANNLMRTSTRLSSSMRTSVRTDNNASMFSSIFNQQRKKHASFIS